MIQNCRSIKIEHRADRLPFALAWIASTQPNAGLKAFHTEDATSFLWSKQDPLFLPTGNKATREREMQERFNFELACD